MLLNRLFCLLLVLCCFFSLAGTAFAAEVDCGSTYCFSTEDFSADPSISGICITELPENAGVLRLGSRILRAGDILTADQMARMTFSPARTETDRSAEVSYLPIYGTQVAPETAMTISIRGREDKAPAAEDSTLETYKNLPNTGKLKVTDPEGQSLTFTLTRQPRRGTVELGADGSFTYTPKKNKVGVDSFVYTATDPAGNVSREATVTVTILKPSDATQYTDTLGKDCRFAAEWMKHTGIFVGEQLGESSCFSPEKEVTRGEFVTMLVKTLEIPTEEELLPMGYTDEIPVWLQPYLAAAVRSGLTAGLEEQHSFGAQVPITAQEVSVLLHNALDVSAAFSGDLDTPITRADAAQILYQAAKTAQNQKLDTIA
ncbi:MAG: cadherin-like domain-containing protein [Oscillospiraceae bacterium]|nr:cadherin-like domain-containing protein [Oscillospiraceae bacterium]